MLGFIWNPLYIIVPCLILTILALVTVRFDKDLSRDNAIIIALLLIIYLIVGIVHVSLAFILNLYESTTEVILAISGLICLGVLVVVGERMIWSYLSRFRTRVRRPRRQKREAPKRVTDGIRESREIIRPARPSRFRCLECGEFITGAKAVCPECGTQQTRCTVCHQFIGQEELYNKCPHCEQFAHRAHLLEWIKVKGICPYCRRKLRERDVR